MKRTLPVVVTVALCSLVAFAQPAPAPPPPKPPKGSKELLARGKVVYETSCLVCHGAAGQGDGPAGVALTPPPRNMTKDPLKQGSRPEDVFKTVSEGVPGTAMVGWPQLAEEDRWAVAFYVLEWVPKQHRNKRPPAPPPAKK